jgi:hypothetical protein
MEQPKLLPSIDVQVGLLIKEDVVQTIGRGNMPIEKRMQRFGALIYGKDKERNASILSNEGYRSPLNAVLSECISSLHVIIFDL